MTPRGLGGRLNFLLNTAAARRLPAGSLTLGNLQWSGLETPRRANACAPQQIPFPHPALSPATSC